MQLLQNGKQQFIDANGAPLAGGSVFHYAPGTTTPVTTYKDPAGQAANQNPVPLDARGQAVIWGAGTVRQIVVDAFGVTIWDQLVSVPDITAPANSLATQLLSKIGASLIGSIGNITGEVARSTQAAMQDVVSLGRFGPVGDGVEVAKNNAAWKAIEAYVNSFPTTTFAPIGVFIPDGHYLYSYTPTFTRPVRIFSNGGAILDYTGNAEVMVFGSKAQTTPPAGTNDYYEVDNVCFTGAASATYGLYFSNWVLQPKVTNCRFLNFGSANMYALTFQGNNWSIDVLDNRYLVTDSAAFARNWCQVLGVSNTTTAGTVSAGQVMNGSYDGGNSRLNALNNWVRFGGSTTGIGYTISGTKSRIVGGGVENPSVAVFFDATGGTIFDAEVSGYFETPTGTAVFKAAGRISGLDIHDCFVNLHNTTSYNSSAQFFITAGSAAILTSASFRDLVILSAGKYPLVTLRDATTQGGNAFSGRILTDAPLLGAIANNYSIEYRDYLAGYHNNDLLGGLDTSFATITQAQARISSRLRVNAGSNLTASVAAASGASNGAPPCRNKHFALTWTTSLASGNYIALEARMDDLGLFSGGIVTAGIALRYVNNVGATSIPAVLQITTNVGGQSTVIASKNITLTNTFQGFSLPQVVPAVETADTDFLSLNLVIQGASHTGNSALEILNMDVSRGEFPPPIMGVDRPRQVATANQWWRKVSSSMSQASAVTSLPVQIGSGWATAVRSIKQISLAGATSATVTPFGDSSVYVQPSPATGTFDIVFSVEAEN